MNLFNFQFNVLKSKLESFKFDIMLNNPVTSCPKCSLCDKAKGNNTHEPWFKFFCYQLVRNLETAETINSNSMDTKKSRCKSLIYWMHDKVVNINKTSGIKKDDNIIKDLLGVWTNFNDSALPNNISFRCEVPDVSEFNNLEEMKKKKTMSDYCENYDTLKKILKNFGFHDNCHIYYDYFRDSLRKYREIAKKCNTNDFINESCSRFCTNDDPEDVLNTPKCRTIETSLEKNDYITKNECDQLRKPVPELSCETKEVKIPEFTFSDNRAIILILFSLWGIFLSLLFLYKVNRIFL